MCCNKNQFDLVTGRYFLDLSFVLDNCSQYYNCIKFRSFCAHDAPTANYCLLLIVFTITHQTHCWFPKFHLVIHNSPWCLNLPVKLVTTNGNSLNNWKQVWMHKMFSFWPSTKALPYSILHNILEIDLTHSCPLRRIACVE